MLLLALEMKERPTCKQLLKGEKGNEMDFPTASRRNAALKTHFGLLPSRIRQ